MFSTIQNFTTLDFPLLLGLDKGSCVTEKLVAKLLRYHPDWWQFSWPRLLGLQSSIFDTVDSVSMAATKELLNGGKELHQAPVDLFFNVVIAVGQVSLQIPNSGGDQRFVFISKHLSNLSSAAGAQWLDRKSSLSSGLQLFGHRRPLRISEQ